MRIPIATSLVALAAVVLAAPEGDAARKADVVRVATAKGVVAAFARTETEPPAIRVNASDAATPPRPDQTALCALPRERIEAYRLALVPVLEGTELRGFEVTTAKPDALAPRDDARDWLHFTVVEGISALRVETDGALALRPRFEEISSDAGCGEMEEAAPEKRFAGFDLIAMPKGGAPEAMGEERAARLDLPAEPNAELRYGVILRPIWKEPGVTLTGYDAILVSTPSKTEPSRAEEAAPKG